MPNSRIAICLYKDEITSFDYTAFFAGTSLAQVDLNKKGVKDVWVYQRGADPKEPEWVEFVKSFAKISPDDLQTSTSGAVVVIKVKKRFLACCFGTSVANINRDSIVGDFGLAIVFGRMIRNNTKSIQSFSLSVNPITNIRTSSVPSTQDSFNIDSFSENITELKGFYKKDNKKNLIKGKEFYSCPSSKTLGDLINQCADMVSEYRRVSNEAAFLKLTSTRKVKDRSLIETLNDELCNSIELRSEDICIDDFEYLPNGCVYKLNESSSFENCITVEDLYSTIRKDQDVSVEYLKNRRIHVFDQDENHIESWSIYKSLFYSLNMSKSHYILYRGHWYEVDENFVSGLQKYISQFDVDVSKIFPKWKGKGEREDDYSKRCSKHINGQYWDKKMYIHPNYNYGIEFCDILTEEFIICVKPYKASSTNSHLLLQTAVSAQLLDSDPSFLKWIADTSNDEFSKLLLEKRVDTIKRNKTFLLLLLSDKKGKPSEILPFFSLISFKLVLSRISSLGFNVSVAVM